LVFQTGIFPQFKLGKNQAGYFKLANVKNS